MPMRRKKGSDMRRTVASKVNYCNYPFPGDAAGHGQACKQSREAKKAIVPRQEALYIRPAPCRPNPSGTRVPRTWMRMPLGCPVRSLLDGTQLKGPYSELLISALGSCQIRQTQLFSKICSSSALRSRR